MRDKERRLLRCIGELDSELILEADTTRFHSRIGHWLALAACAALLISVPFLLPGQPSGESPAMQTESIKHTATSNKEALTEDCMEAPAGFHYYDHPTLFSERIGDLRIDMTEQEILDLMGEPVTTGNVEMKTPDGAVHKSWFYKTGTNPDVRVDTQLSLANVGRGWFLNEIYLWSGSSLTLSTGIGLGSWIDQVQEAYPDAVCFEGTSVVNDKTVPWKQFTIGDPAVLSIQVENGVTSIRLGPWLQLPGEDDWETAPEPAYDLTSSQLTYCHWTGKDWEQTRIIDKAAKHICTTMTISYPEETAKEKDGVSDWLDFGNGTAVELRGEDIASVYTYSEDTFDPDKTDGLTWHLQGRYTGLDAAVAASLENPTETWK